MKKDVVSNKKVPFLLQFGKIPIGEVSEKNNTKGTCFFYSGSHRVTDDMRAD